MSHGGVCVISLVVAQVAEGLGYGNNCKAALMRIGFAEMRLFIEHFFPGGPDVGIYFE